MELSKKRVNQQPPELELQPDISLTTRWIWCMCSVWIWKL